MPVHILYGRVTLNRTSASQGRSIDIIGPTHRTPPTITKRNITMRTPEQEFAVRCLGGHPTGLDASIFVIEADGECQSLNGSHILCDRWFPSLPAALDLLTTEFPDDDQTPFPQERKNIL